MERDRVNGVEYHEPQDDLIRRLLRAGYSPVALSLALRVDLDDVMALQPEERTHEHSPDSVIEDGLRVLAWRTIEEASRMLDEGTPAIKMQLIKTFGADMRATLGAKNADQNEEMKTQLAALMRAIRGEEDLGELGAVGSSTHDPH